MTWTLEAVLAATGGEPLQPGTGAAFTVVSTDSRSIRAGELYVPLVGKTFDGHAFVDDAIARGATGVLAARPLSGIPADVAVVRVQDTLAAYGDLARAHRVRFDVPVVAITGSSGKTSTKEWVADLLGLTRRVHRTTGNLNNEIGLPRTLLGLDGSHEAVVVEMGMRGLGQIAYLTSIARPTIGVVTHIGTAHIELLGSREAIARAKGELFRVGGPTLAAVVNADDPRSTALGDEHPGPVATFSLHDPAATVHAEGSGRTFVARWQAGPRTPSGSLTVELPQAGDHHRANALAAIAAAWHLGWLPSGTWRPAASELPGRARVLRVGEIEIWDETYNANPESMRATLRAIAASADGARCLAVLGDMGELGAHADDGHREVGEAARAAGIVELVTIGTRGSDYARGFGRKTHPSASIDEALDLLLPLVRPGDRILVKASRAMRLEQLVEALEQRLAPAPETTA
jgi:UDP-N-acetylmuramoyl-tripeptide--D-alanyl-D-alanine ligase